jgi:mannitol-1-phosphate 5-dehydrogenase
MKGNNPLRIITESYKTLYVDKNAFKGEIPEIKNIIAYSPFEYIIEQKLYIYNMGHAVCAYLGDIVFYTFGYDFIWRAIEDPYIKMLTAKTMECSALALSKIYNVDMNDLTAYIDDLIHRFANRSLGDTVKRVGNDIKRKLAPNDRIVGAYRICSENGISVKYHCLAIAAAANFRSDNLSGQSLEDILKAAGSYDLLAGNPDDFALVKKFDKAIKDCTSVKDLCETVNSMV